MVDVAGLELTPEDREVLRHPLVGSVILFTRNYASSEQLTRLVADIHAVRTPALIVGVDHEGGRVQRFRQGFSALPPLRRIGHEFDLDARHGLTLARSMGWLMAAELRAHGVDLSFAPCVDLDYGVSEVIGDRAFHSKPEAVAKLLDGLACDIQPSSHLRLVRMRGRAAPERDELYAGDTWRASQDLLARSVAAPKLNLTAGNA
jgi:beta-N-acetylhexosaminidase